MSLLSTLAGALEGAAGASGPQAGPAPGAVIAQLLAMIQSHPGGLAGMMQAFQQGGLGHLFQSWVGTGANLPVTPDQLRNALGADWISRITQATGLPQSEIESHLSTLLPQIVNHLSPGGQLPQGDLGGALAQVAQRLLHG